MIECIANLSEGRDAAAIEAMAAAVCRSPARLLDVHSDGDHHRSVFTFVGTPAHVERAALALACEAVARIDLRAHRGVHPRIGAVDVLPFAPLGDATIEDCVAIARRVGEQIAVALGVPVYLYARAASRPERASLAALRRGGLAGLEERMADPAWKPDFGPAWLHPTAGAAAVGGRPPLVAYNVVLDTSDLAVARSVASAVRAAGGGPPGVQALAFFLESARCAQVSMNLTQVESGCVAAAFDRVRDLAEACGTRVAWSELVGLAPRVALTGCTTERLRLRDRMEAHVLEDRWEAA